MGSNQEVKAISKPLVEPSFDSNDASNENDSSVWDKIETEEDFVSHCMDSLMLPDRKRHFITQIDFSSFLSDMCNILDGDEAYQYVDCPLPTFETLDPNIQYVFVRGICEGSEDDIPQDCIAALLEPGIDFGYSVTKKTRRDVEDAILDVCCGIMYFVRVPGLERAGKN
jgi:hypothetical protein